MSRTELETGPDVEIIDLPRTGRRRRFTNYVAVGAMAIVAFTAPVVAVAGEPWSSECVNIFRRAAADLTTSDPFFARGVVGNEQKASTVQFLVVSFQLKVNKRIIVDATVSDFPYALAQSTKLMKPGSQPNTENTSWTAAPRRAQGGFDVAEGRFLNEREGSLATRTVNKKRTKLFSDRFRIAIDQCMALPYFSTR